MTPVVLIAAASTILSGALAIGVAFRAGRSTARWAFAVGMTALTIECLCKVMSLRAGVSAPGELVQWRLRGLWALSFVPSSWLLFSLTYARGDAGIFLKRWRITLAAAVLIPLALTTVFRGDLFVSLKATDRDAAWLLGLGWSGMLLYLCLLLTAVAVTMNLERTFRASAGIHRWRIKFMLFGVATLFLVRLYTSSQVLLFRGIGPEYTIVDLCGLLVASLLILRSIFRAGNFELDVHPSQSVLHGSVTLFLAGAYLIIIGILAKLVEVFGGEGAFAFKAFLLLISLVLLAVLLQSDRVRLRLGRFVSRHFQRPLYDYRTLWREFTESTASRVEQTDLCRSLVKLTAHTFQSHSVTIWLVDDEQEALILGDSTSLPRRSHDDHSHRVGAAEVLGYFREHHEVVGLAAARGPWADFLREWHPAVFSDGGDMVCVPLVGRGELLGLMVIGDRVSGLAFSSQDFDIFKCIGDHAAANLLNLQLSRRLLQNKELEAFQTMATFFVHDLKNAASTLNLMLKNLPVHFNDPAFREDALRGMSKTVTHINNLIGRLSRLRHDLKLQLVPTDLNAMVEHSLAALGNGPTCTFIKEMVALPPAPLDREQIQKVITNLLLNGNEAVNGRGTIRIATEQVGDSVVLTVADDGCGMTREFLQRSLFRPFQTTKKGGLGIGMFQSKMIVEAHHGRITVASEPGKGTTFRVFLPVMKAAG
jgi:putative PEP-CTERM system histidine kinase